jgi:response regulator RpfG family c-di-GMP phosphodiesterase
MKDTILLVDDDIRVVSALQRSLHRNYEIEIAGNATDALGALEHSNYAVTVSDFQMPEMNGVEFLAKVRQIAPDTVRILLTGHAEVEVAIAAVNEGNIFRLLTKPCPMNVLTSALDAALNQYRLMTAESEALRETLTGTVAVLMEMLSVVQPLAFGAADRVLRHVRKIARALQLKNTWELEAAAMLSTIGCASVSPTLLRKYYSGEAMSDEESEVWLSHPQNGRSMLESVPRLKSVAQMVERQMDYYQADSVLRREELSAGFGAQILHVAHELERSLGSGRNVEAAISHMRAESARYHPEILSALDAAKDQFFGPLDAEEPMTDFQRLGSTAALFRPITDQVLRALRH